MHQDWDIFCRVIDNYGDIGVCWRLARQLVREHGKTVRLWVDDLPSLSAICPEALPDVSSQQVAGVRICHWRPDFVTNSTASVVIEAFACELPPDYIAAMAQQPQRPCWINLDYLTAEAWADGCHGMASPHPERFSRSLNSSSIDTDIFLFSFFSMLNVFHMPKSGYTTCVNPLLAINRMISIENTLQ